MDLQSIRPFSPSELDRLSARYESEQEVAERVAAWRERRSQTLTARLWRQYGGLVGWVGAPLLGAGIWWLLLRGWL